MIELTKGQKEAVEKASKWYRKKDKEIFEISGYAGCIDKDSMLVTENGLMTMEEYITKSTDNLDFVGFKDNISGIKVYNGKKFVDVSHVYATEDKTKGYIINTARGKYLKASEIHPVLTVKNGKYKWKKVKDLKMGDLIVTLGSKNIFNTEGNTEYRFNDQYLLGLILTYGSFEDDNIVLKLVPNRIGLKLKDYMFTKFNHKIALTSANGYNTITIPLNRKLRKVTNKINGRLHTSHFNSDKRKLDFLRGLNEGLIYQGDKLFFTHPNRKVFYTFIYMMSEFGVVFKVRNYENHWFRYYSYLDDEDQENIKRFARIFITPEDKRLANLINRILNHHSNKEKIRNKFFNRKNKTDKLLARDGYVYDIVTDKYPIKQKFFDITVPEGHSFVANGIVNHNTGKTTCVHSLIEELGIDREKVAFATYTGKASLVLTLKGCPATTIHKLIYIPQSEYKIMVDSSGSDIKDEKGNTLYEDDVSFIKKPKSMLDNIELIVLDECSMIDEDMLKDLLSFEKPIIVLGDTFQLPPIKGESILLKNPDVELTEIMRQKEGDPIVYLATKARLGEKIDYGSYGHCHIFEKSIVDLDVNYKTNNCDGIFRNSNVVLCRSNAVRNGLNKHIREVIYGRTSKFPNLDDKIICRRNNWDIGIKDEYDINLVNGLIGKVYSPVTKEDIHMDSSSIYIDFMPEMCKEDYFDHIPISIIPFIDSDNENYKRILAGKQASFFKKKGNICNSFEYAYAITVHLSQGSQWKKVFIYDEPYGSNLDYRKSLYTAITRAEKQVVIAK